jgi:hypothetical protein
MESWQKWSFAFSPLRQGSGDPAGWSLVGKRRRISRFLLAGERVVAGVPEQAGELGCAVELTEVRVRGEAWWSLGFEATGPAGLLRRGLEATAALVFAQAVPGRVGLGTEDSRSYAEWLAARGGHGVLAVRKRRALPSAAVVVLGSDAGTPQSPGCSGTRWPS